MFREYVGLEVVAVGPVGLRFGVSGVFRRRLIGFTAEVGGTETSAGPPAGISLNRCNFDPQLCGF